MDFYANKALLSCGFIALNGSLNRWVIIDKKDVLECLISISSIPKSETSWH